MTANEVSRPTYLDQPPFSSFPLQRARVDGAFYIDALGGRTRRSYHADAPIERLLGDFEPARDEGLLQWEFTLEAILAAKDSFSMIELGAGYGRWLSIAALAMRRTRNLPMHLVGVEAEPEHFRWMRRHMRLNTIEAELIEAAVATHEGEAEFYTGSPGDWYGQALAPAQIETTNLKTRVMRTVLRKPRQFMDTIQRVRAVTLASLIDRRIDLIHSDIQNAELAVFPGSMPTLDANVARIVIGTHSVEAEEALRAAFTTHGWTCVHDCTLMSTSDTPYGPLGFSDGVQAWKNPRLLER